MTLPSDANVSRPPQIMVIDDETAFARAVRKRLRRAGMDYLDHVTLTRHRSWQAFQSDRESGSRLVLLTTRASTSYADFQYQADDTLMVGQESAGVPDDVHAIVDGAVKVPMLPELRSLNVALAAAMVLGEALRQTQQLPDNE